MNIGMLWFDNDPRTEVQTKIERAAMYYRTKYGSTPNLCFIHPSMLAKNETAAEDKPVKNGNIEVRTSPTVLPNHFWIGINGTIRPSES
jgi:hypothetical protein